MIRTLLAASIACAVTLPALAQDNPFSAFKGKIREGNWEYKMQMEGVPGMPPGMKMPERTFSNCVTAQDVERGGGVSKDGKLPETCVVKNMKMTGNTASYTMECTKPSKMTVDSTVTFGSDTFTTKQNMAMEQNGQMMNMSQTMTGRYTGPCTAAAPKK